MMATPSFQIGAYTISPALGLVSGPDGSVHLEPKVMDLLVFLAERAGEVVSRNQIIERVWRGTLVTDEVITRAVYQIRKDSTPVYLFHGDKDTTLSVENSRRLYAKGKEVGADIQYTEVKNAPHGFGTECTPSIAEISALPTDALKPSGIAVEGRPGSVAMPGHAN